VNCFDVKGCSRRSNDNEISGSAWRRHLLCLLTHGAAVTYERSGVGGGGGGGGKFPSQKAHEAVSLGTFDFVKFFRTFSFRLKMAKETVGKTL